MPARKASRLVVKPGMVERIHDSAPDHRTKTKTVLTRQEAR